MSTESNELIHANYIKMNACDSSQLIFELCLCFCRIFFLCAICSDACVDDCDDEPYRKTTTVVVLV